MTRLYIPAGRALVLGYDVYALASPDRIAVGVELSAGAVAAAQAFQYPCTTPENAQFKQGNFFELGHDTWRIHLELLLLG